MSLPSATWARRRFDWACFAACAWWCSGAVAQDPDAAGFADTSQVGAESSAAASDAAGFGDAVFAAPTSQSPPHAFESAAPSRTEWSARGAMRVQSAVRLERSGPYRLGKLRQILNAQLQLKHRFGDGGLSLIALASGRSEADFAVLMQRDAYDAPTRDLYEWQLVPWEAYVKARSSRFELTLGNQIVNLGQGEVLSVLDIANPRDLREPLLGDPEEQRMPVPMARATVTIDSVRLDAMWLPSPYFGFVPPPLGEWSPFRKLLSDDPTFGAALHGRMLRNRHVPSRALSLDASQLHAQISWSGSGVDLALHFSDALDMLGVPELPDASAYREREIEIRLHHPRYRVAGLSFAATLGPLLLRAELATEIARPLALENTQAQILEVATGRYTTLRGLLGVTYVPSGSTNAGLEVTQTYVVDNPARTPGVPWRPLFPVEATQVALRVTHSFWRDRASLTLIALLVGIDRFNAFAGRVDMGYKLTDAMDLMIGAVMYAPSRDFGFFYGFDRHDRVFMNWRWTFIEG